jgi:hypothetical protein
MVSGKSEPCKLFLYDEVVKILLSRELIAEAESVVIETETDGHPAFCRGLHEVYEKFVVIVPDLGLLTPYRLPGLVEG